MNRETEPFAHADDAALEGKLRPSNLDEFVGQSKVKKQLQVLLQAAEQQQRVPDHLLFSGPPGLGKTTLAMIVAKETGRSLRVTSGPTIQHAGDLAAILSSLEYGEILFIDEIHRVSRAAEEMLYLAMEDFRVDVMVGKGPGATSVPLDLERFTLVGATTRAGMLPNPLRDRFGFTASMEFYEQEDLIRVLERTARVLNVKLDNQSLEMISQSSRGTPRVANRLLRRIRDYAQVQKVDSIDSKTTADALEIYEIDEAGLDRLDRQYLSALAENRNRALGLGTLATRLGEEPETVELVVEPFLLRLGFIERTPKGRLITNSGLATMGIESESSSLFD
ncbi:MAG: Holliday junction branch migration DNA helicase RuvB [Microbacteriaceae bacterium]|nr:Holliday junction branch migration DNA helicase RuvB [Microbacteriaceae bacterium]MDR9443504.1 Holliday junction branch migration DNA helicase RuvB [Microbacteriaceae bacterium]